MSACALSTDSRCLRSRLTRWARTRRPSCYYSSPAVPINKVVIINADHFDLGYHGLIKDVANMYFVSARPLSSHAQLAFICSHRLRCSPAVAALLAETLPRSQQDKFWPLALKISADLRAGNHSERYVYTTFSWLASAYLSCPPNSGLHCPSAAELTAFKAAVKLGDITWPAFPFNSEHAAYDPRYVHRPGWCTCLAAC